MQETGRRVATKYVTLLGKANTLGHDRLGVIASRRLGNAVMRNRAKRRLRELFRHTHPDDAGRDVRPRLFAVISILYLPLFPIDLVLSATTEPVAALVRLIVFLMVSEALTGDGSRPHRPVLFGLLLMMSAAAETKLDALNHQFDALLAQMQTPKARRGMKTAFAASAKQLGKAAVAAARSRG